MLLSSCGLMLPFILGSLLLLSSIHQVNAEPKVISMETKRMSRNALHKRDATELDLHNGIVLYALSVSVGTPEQTIALQIDTANYGTWLPGPELASDPNVAAGGTYDPEKSKSKSNASIDGLDSPYAQGGYINDDLALGNYKLPKLRMGVAQATDFFAGRLGLRMYNLNQDDAPTMQNSTILDSMVANGLIKRRAYRLWRNTIDADKGSIIFGGVDTEKFEGELKWINISATVPAYVFMVGMSYTLGETTIASEGMVNPDGEQVASTTTATGEASATANPTDSDANDPAGVLAEALRFLAMFVTFDATSYVSMIPLSLFDPLAKLFGAVQIGDSPLYTVPCSLPKEGSISFQFDNLENGPIIKIPFSELAFPIPDWMQPGSGPLTFEDEEKETPACGFGLTPFDTEGMMVLGQTFMRSAYIVFDHDDMTVGLANARWNVMESNIVEFNTEGLLDSALTTSASSVSATPSVADDQATGTASVSATNVGTSSSNTFASESAVTTASTASGDHTFTQTSTDSASSSNTSFVSAAWWKPSGKNC